MKYLIPLAGLLLALPAAAQQTRPVSDVQEFLFELGGAAPADLILMEPGVYAFHSPDEFLVDAPVRIAARIPGTVTIETETGAYIEGIPADGFVSLDGLTFRLTSSPTQGTGPALTVRFGLGIVFANDCRFEGYGPWLGGTSVPALPGVLVDVGALVASNCEFIGSPATPATGADFPGSGLHAITSEVQLDNCAVAAPDGEDATAIGPPQPAKPGGHALTLVGGSFHAARTRFEAGEGGDGIEYVFGSCLPGEPGGDAIRFEGILTSFVDLHGCDLVPGFGGFDAPSAACGGGVAPLGQEFGGPALPPSAITSSPFPLGLDVPGQIQGGGYELFTLWGVEYASSKWLLLSSGAYPGFSTTIGGFPPVVTGGITFVPLPTSGSQVFTIPNLGTSGLHLGIVVQGLELPSTLVPILHPARFLGIH